MKHVLAHPIETDAATIRKVDVDAVLLHDTGITLVLRDAPAIVVHEDRLNSTQRGSLSKFRTLLGQVLDGAIAAPREGES